MIAATFLAMVYKRLHDFFTWSFMAWLLLPNVKDISRWCLFCSVSVVCISIQTLVVFFFKLKFRLSTLYIFQIERSAVHSASHEGVRKYDQELRGCDSGMQRT